MTRSRRDRERRLGLHAEVQLIVGFGRLCLRRLLEGLRGWRRLNLPSLQRTFHGGDQDMAGHDPTSGVFRKYASAFHFGSAASPELTEGTSQDALTGSACAHRQASPDPGPTRILRAI